MEKSNNPEIDEYRKCLDRIEKDLIEIYVYIAFFTELFAKNENRVELLNSTAPKFFAMCRNLFIEAVIIRISRITDKAETGGHQNLSIHRLVGKIRNKESDDYKSLQNAVKSLEEKRQEIKTIRDKQLAHLDLGSIDRQSDLTLEAMTEIKNALITIYNLLRSESDSYELDMGLIEEDNLEIRSLLVNLEKGRRYSKLIEDLPIECLQEFIPKDDPHPGKGYFQSDILKFIDNSPQ